ncbi:hypothetical protein HHI36_004446 [Cryptolaemus montrouzieri]|uniref:Abnormal spindle-like microcephaly-associated protein n=1 Tax=Cryptolaemus montrouzieri TaxID=559131 RepID=A0ABD2NS07_9CUCU
MKICREKYIRLKESVVFIQRKFRANKIMAVQRSLYVQLKHTVHFIETKYQAKSLMLKASREFQCLKKYVIFVQRKYRAKRIMQIERNSYLRQRNAAMVLQNHFRSYSMMKKDRKMYIEMKESATIIQKWYKSYKSMLLIRQFFKNLKKAVVVVQEKYRANKTMKIERHLYLQHRMAAIVIQKYFRSYLLMKRERKQYLEMRTAVCIIQEKYRANMLMKVCKNGFIALKKVTIIIQRRYRANKMMKIQRFAYLEQRKAAIHIQRTFRGYCRMKIEKACFKSSISAIKTIQRYGRGFLTRKKYAPLLTPEAREERRIKKIQEAAATKIQACWRGYSQRSKDQHALKIIRQRSMQAQNDAQVQNSLGSRSERALEILVAEDITLPLIISALSDFEYITRRSQIVCRSLGPILPEQLYLLIKSVARSLPEIEICVLSTYTLINLCKYPPTSAMTWFPEHLDSMVRIMLHWCDKEEMAFPGLCTLFWLFAHNAEYKKVILDLPNLVSQIEKIKTLILRKQKMVMRSANKLITSKFYPKRNLPLPGLRPDWGFDYTKRPRTFTNSVHAIESLIAILN